MSTIIRSKVSPGEVIACIDDSKGQLYPITRALRCTRSAVQEIFDEYPEINERFLDAEEDAKDRVILGLLEDAEAGDHKARELFLKSRGRERGFGDKLEISGDKNAPLVFLHAAALDLVGEKPKIKRVESWQNRAICDYAKQIEETKDKSVDELLKVKAKKIAP